MKTFTYKVEITLSEETDNASLVSEQLVQGITNALLDRIDGYGLVPDDIDAYIEKIGVTNLSIDQNNINSVITNVY